MADNIKQGLHGCSREDQYVRPEDPLIRERLEWFQDQKLALMMHYGPYSQLGIDASWALSDGDFSWSRRSVDWEDDPETFRKQYIDMYKSFNPVRFQPDKWAEFAAENGFRYLIFTTKHHDGFCMFDSKYTDYKITNPDCPFHAHKYANIVREVFDAFRKKDIAIAAYFSKPDWNCPWYWAEGMEHPVAYSRNPTYNPAEHPELWEKFTEFTHNQIMELMEDYGRIDILWLDGGQVNPANGQDVLMSELVAKARTVQPWLITADRTVGGENENYITPEQSIPGQAIRIPWESCVTVGSQWGYRFGDTYKSARTLIHMLIQVVSHGGNLALNVGPQPNGELPEEALCELRGLGTWLRVNGEAIYGTRPADIAKVGEICYTTKENSTYALIPLEEHETLSGSILIPWDKSADTVTCLTTGEDLPFENSENGLHVTLSDSLAGSEYPAPVFRIR